MMGKVEKKVEKYARKRGWDVRARMEDGILYLEGKVPSYREYVEIGRFAGKQHVEGVVNNLEYEGKKRRERKEGKREIIDEADVVIIGGGVTGCAIARELAKYKLSIILVEGRGCSLRDDESQQCHGSYWHRGKDGNVKAEIMRGGP